MQASTFMAVVVTAGALCSGCSSEDSVSFKSNGMTHTMAEGKNSIPKDFKLPVYPGATATGSVSAEGSDEEESKFLMLSTTDAMEKVSDYYQDALKEKGWTIDKVDAEAPKMVSITAHMNDMDANVMIADDGGKTTISLSAGKTGDTSKEDAETNNENYTPDKLNPPTD